MIAFAPSAQRAIETIYFVTRQLLATSKRLPRAASMVPMPSLVSVRKVIKQAPVLNAAGYARGLTPKPLRVGPTSSGSVRKVIER